MTRPLLCMLLASLAAFAGSPRPDFTFAADSLTATVTRIGGKATSEPDSLFPSFLCDSASAPVASGPEAWFEIEVIDNRAGTDLRFPLDESALRRDLRIFCREESAPAPARVAAQLRAMASRLRVRMRGPENGGGK